MKAAEEKLKKAQEKQMEALQSFAQTMQTKANAKIEKSGKTAKKKGYQADDQSKLVNEKFNNDEKKQQKIAELAEKVQKAREEYDDLKNEYDFHMEAFRDFRAYVNENAEAYEEAVRTRQATEDACNEAEAALKKADEDSSLSNYEKKWLEKKEEMEAISAKITAKQRQLSSEYWKNLSLCGFDNLDQLDRCLGGAFDENGALKNEVKDTVDLLEDRRKLVESCGEGELTVFWDAFINNDSILTDLLSPDMKVAEGRVQQLHAMLAPLGKALTEEYPYIAKFFIEDKLVKLLDSKSPDTETKKIREELEKITKEMPEKLRKAEELYKKELDAAETPEDEQTAKVKYEKKTENIRKGSVNFWKEQLGAYRNDYLDKKKRGTSSIREKIQEGGAHIRQDLTKHLLYDDEDTKKQFKDRTAKYRKWWFRTSKNTGVELVAQKHKQTKYQIAFANANEIIMNMQDVIINDEAAMNSIVNNTRTTKDYFEKLRDRYLANDEKAEAAFLHYALNKVYKKNTEYEETAIEAAVKELDEEVQKELSDALILFKKHISKPAVQLDTKEFDAVIDRYAADFLTLHRSQQAEYKKNKTEEEKKYEAKRDKERKARAVVMNEKTRGKQLVREKLFGGMYDELGRIGDRKQSLVYTPEKGKQNKKVKSKGEATDKQWLDAARAEFELDDEEKKKKLTVYPDILAVCLDEYCRLHHSYADRYVRLGDKISNWFLSEDNKVETDIKHEARRLKLISRIATGQEEVKGKEMPRLPEKARDLFLVYAARFAPLSADDSTLPDSVIRLAEEFLPYYTEIEKLDAVEVKDPALRYALTDAKEKARAFLFNRDEKGLPSDVQKFTEMLENQRKYFAFADRAVAVLDDETLKNKKIGLLGDEGKRRYTDNIREYFLGRIMDDAMNGTAFDEASYRLAVQERLKGEEAREALVAKSDRISSAEYNYHEDYPGQLTERDLEFAIAATKKKALIKKYNALDWQERKIFALALYCTKDGESGTQKVVYGTDHRLYKEDRQQLLSYIKGENVDFKVDYTRAVRAVAAKSKRTKVSGDSEAFEAAIRYVEQINRRRFELQPKDYSRMADPAAMAKDADRVRAKLISDKADNLTNHNDAINGVKITDRKDFYKILSRMSGEDVKRKQSQGFFDKMPDKYRNFKENNGVQAVCERINKMTQGRRTLLMYILQDRTVLDYSTAGKNSDKIVPHVNEEKRFALMEKLMTEEGRLEALAEAESPEVAERALKSLLSFQLRDDKPLTEGKLTEDDFEPGSLKRVEAIDWMLLANAIDFLDELEQEQRRILAVRQAPLRVLNPTEEMKKKNKPVTDYMKGRSLPKNSEQFEEYLRGAVITDSKLDPGDTKIMDLFRGYMSLTPQEKVLFYRALNHRDVLDVSQRNLYRNFLGLDERDYVNDKERNLLVDEYIEKTTSGEGIDMGTTTYGEAMLSLLSTQINDDMNFEEVDGSNWAYKNLNVDNQLFVFDSRSKYVIDWKLFERGLQLVTRTVAERKASAGDKALYENLGDKMNGEFSMDRSFMRRNLHHTGARFMRFLAREGYSQIEDSLGIIDSAAGWAEFVVSTKTANFLHSKANAFAKKPAGEEEKEEEAKEEEAKDEDKQVEAKADAKEEKAVSFVRSLGSLVSSVKDQYDSIKEMKDKVRETYGEYRDLIVGEEEEEEEKLPENEEERKKFLEKKAEREKAEAELKEIRAQKPTDLDKEIGGIPLPPGKDVLGTVLALGEKLPGYKEMADKYLKDPEMLEKVDNYISRVFKDKISAKTLGEWYTAADEWVEDKKDTVFGFVADDHLPAEVKDTMDQLLNIAENTTEVLEKVAGYLTPAIGILGDIKNMWEARNNMKELDEKKAEAGELKKNDDDLIGGVDVTEKTRQILEEAREENALLLNTNNTDVKNIQKRNMLGSAANVVKGGLKLAGVNGADKAVDAVADFIKFIHKCMTDKDAVMNYYKSGGSGAVSKLLDGQMKMAEVFHTNNGIEVKSMDIDIVGTNNYSIGKNGLKELQHGLGFERQGELADHVRLCMVNALLFSASKFNPLKQPRLLAITALKVLGVEDAIGKTDAETAMRVFTKLKD
ncbi:MAG: hypothetical protein IKI75_11650 [Lachnospiraceae bacterium]|nr:hypothetical protein [Lachnospiraceae bacterium]